MGAAGCLALVLVSQIGGVAARAQSSPAERRAPTRPRVLDVQEGTATYYGRAFDGKTTASGIPFDMNALVAAHPSYPFGTLVRVVNLRNRRSVQVRIVDRGPSREPQTDGVIIDLSRAAAAALRFIEDGRTRVRLEVLRWGESDP